MTWLYFIVFPVLVVFTYFKKMNKILPNPNFKQLSNIISRNTHGEWILLYFKDFPVIFIMFCTVLYCVCVCLNIVSSCHVVAPKALQWLSVISCEIWGTCSSDWKSELICWSSCCRCLIWSKPFKALQINTLHNLTAPQTDGFLQLPELEYENRIIWWFNLHLW